MKPYNPSSGLDLKIVRHLPGCPSGIATPELPRITQEVGAKRYFRALKELRTILAAMPGGLGRL